MYTYSYMYRYMNGYMYINLDICKGICQNIYLYTYKCIRMHTYIHIYAYDKLVELYTFRVWFLIVCDVLAAPGHLPGS